MAELFADLPEALANSVRDRAALQLRVRARQEPAAGLPDAQRRVDRGLPAPSARSEGLEARLAELYPEEAARARGARALRRAPRVRAEDHHPDGLRRLLPHRRGLHQLGADATACPWGRAAAPARARSSRTALGITDLDPLRYELLFERFLNPERVSMPDFDIDFCQDGRDRVIDYVKQKYGARVRLADRHLRHHGGEGGGARRGARARHALRRGRPHREARALRARHHARRRRSRSSRS